MKSGLSHLQISVHPENVAFYKDLFTFFGWQTIYDGEGMTGLAGKNGESFWFTGAVKEHMNDYDGPGVNHISIAAESQADVDSAASYLTDKGVGLLFETPHHRPEFSGEGSTYYQIMWEGPDRILFEFVYSGPK